MRERLMNYLDENKLSVVEFAEISGVSKTTLYDILKGGKDVMKIGISQCMKIANTMEISVEELFGRKIPEPTPERTTLTRDERELLDAWRCASDAAKESVLMVLKANPAPVSKKSAG